MSAYGHQMERDFSVQSLLSREDTGTEMGSRYVLESGFYMTSFAATIFIAGLLTTGVLLVTLVVTLAVMLQSCESRSKGVVQIHKGSDVYHYCKAFSSHGELNSLKQSDIPPVCQNFSYEYIEHGEYERDLNLSISMIESFFETISPSNSHPDVVLVDIDDILDSDPAYSYQLIHQHQFNLQYGSNKPSGSIEDATNLKLRLTVELCMKLQSRGWSLILLSRKPERLRNVTIEHLNTIGFISCPLILRSDDEMGMESWEYFSRRRGAISRKQGNEIVSVISSRMDALTGSSLGKRVFKLPKPWFYQF
ncbi:uncharacterized protein At2g39920-like [Hibiscus syriacus]|uniref:uncharacterized protein At2g39920-like n=1 Tax=Hibiscus syriacus TaxID=106335 RepID=UPI0019208089|nr:uncharacterized protein At2g39920-like [Hibiscus syriacus]